ncbi:MAG: CocE/NonD family hydrolase [Gemmatimonadetes bacterium]|nr:CocE/NonD family hydrolase [Gemmatimonadota bacterium]
MAETEVRGSWIEYDVIVRRNVMVPMRDGVKLATDLYFPAKHGEIAQGAFPAVIERTPYDKESKFSEGRYLARRGYVAVRQDVRGRFESEGEWHPFAKEAPDGYDTVEWVAAQPWCDGNVGTMGGSYCGSDQSALATLNPPHLKAMVVAVGTSNYHTSSMRQNGALELRFMIYAFRMATTSREALADATLKAALDADFARVGEWLTRTPYRKGSSALRFLPSYEQWVLDLLGEGDFNEYWKQRGYAIDHYYDEHADVPTIYLGGWYDTYTRGTTANYVALSKRMDSPQHLLMGPWTHGGWGNSFAGDVDFGQDSVLDDYDGYRLRWFDRWLKGIDNGVDREKPVRIFVMGGGDGRRNREGRLNYMGVWRDVEDWPLHGTRFTPYYLHQDGSIGEDLPEPSEPSRYTFDPRDPVPTVGGNLSAGDPILVAGAYDQRGDSRFYGCRDNLPLSARSDVLVFQTPELKEPLEVTGPLTMKLWASSSATDTDFTVKLIDVHPPNEDYPDCFAQIITDSIVRGRYRNSRDTPELMSPGEIHELEVVMYPTSIVFGAGHRIRVDVSSSNFPRFDVNPNTGGPLGRDRRVVLAENAVFHDPEHPSHIVLPIIPGC